MTENTIFILSNHDYFNRSGAAIARIYNYARALTLDENTKVVLLSFKLSGRLDSRKELFKNTFVAGENPIHANKGTAYFLRNFYFISSFLFLAKLVREIRRNHVKPFSFIIFSMRIFDDILILLFLKVWLGSKVVCEKNEILYTIILNKTWPTNYFKKFIFLLVFSFKISTSFLTDLMVVFYDGVIAISTNIRDWVLRYNKNVVLIPILSNDNFLPDKKPGNASDDFMIGYAGSLTLKKDGLRELILSIQILVKEGHKIRLNIFGSGNKEDVSFLNSLIASQSLSDHVFMRGQVTQAALQEELRRHDLLVLPRPESKQAHYGFSTKLAEYLSTGIPVLATDVSDNKRYLQDGINAYLLDDLTPENLAEKLKKIIREDKDKRDQIGLNGLSVSQNEFHFSKHSNTLLSFLQEIPAA